MTFTPDFDSALFTVSATFLALATLGDATNIRFLLYALLNEIEQSTGTLAVPGIFVRKTLSM